MSLPATFQWFNPSRVENALNNLNKPTLFYFMEPGGNLSELINPVITRVCKPLAKNMNLYAINPTENKDLTYEMSIMKYPSFVLYLKGEEIRRYTDIDYQDRFESNFKDFLKGDFLFPKDAYVTLDSMNYFSSLQKWSQYSLVGFMKPGDIMNWELLQPFQKLQNEYSNFLRLCIVNVERNEDLAEHYVLENFPSFLLLKGEQLKEEWDPASNPESIKRTCIDKIESEVTS